MADILTGNFDEVLARFGGARRYIEQAVKRVVSAASIKLQRHIRQDLFQPYPGGTTATTLSTRSGILKKSIKTIPPVVDGTDVRGGLTIGTKYSPVHFGKRGQVTVITQKIGKKLHVKGKSAGSGVKDMTGGIVPLFKLVRSVSIPARIHPEDLREWINPHITEGLQAIKQGLENSSLSDNFGTGTDGII